ncbi:MAG: acetyl-CoA carboxylase, carboxyltransferase subunit beta [Bacteroidota bacterium]|jgi:acetyl-CoA carboxylase carboxyl transferase subunit beta|nr:acetyl-CoA carboxylase, carboxyltransferase subunit beta [Bacteroidota bacterium]|tara:strand:+ start:3801 stop:4667 length:867 start_codon:yes stop_codon:yes gene_type:complete
MAWFRRKLKGIRTETKEKKDTPEGLWHKTPSGNIVDNEELINNNYVSPADNFHLRIGSSEYFKIFFDNEYEVLFENLKSSDPLNFTDKKSYKDRIEQANVKSGLNEAIKVAYGDSFKKKLTIAAMDFKYIGGSMGSVVGEKICRAIDHSINNKSPLVIISKSGGARMMEGAISLMQMAKTAAKLTQLSEKKIPYISLCTDPTTGGTTASFAMLGDIIISEPGALIGFAGPRVVKDTTGQDLPQGFQSSEFLLEHGFIDFISHRNDLKLKINFFIDLIQNNPLRNYNHN